ncbi:PTS transporter subunit EIIC [Paenibacillus polymyxa]|uniref:PTS transporter subunit EIIC n=1 Tax=Paenibacillus polymyxa TaxID=1406 RepID=UPI0032AF752D
MSYEVLCNEIVKSVGKNNIKDAFHCVTRLRLIIDDMSQIDREELKKIDGVLQVREVGNQLQLVIGTHVTEVHKEFCAIIGMEIAEDQKDSNKGGGEKDQIEVKKEDEVQRKSIGSYLNPKNLISSLLSTIAFVINPIVAALVAGGMVKGITASIVAFGWLAADSSIIAVLNLIGDAPFYFMPFLVGYTSAKKFKIPEVYGIMVAGVLLAPTLLNQTAGPTIEYIFFDIPAIKYTNDVFSTLLSVYVFSLVYKAIDKFITKNLKMAFSAFLAFVLAMPLILGFISPLGYYLTSSISSGMTYLFSVSGPLAGLLYAGLKPITIIFGIKGWGPIILANLSNNGYDYLLTLAFISNVAVSGAALGAALKINNEKDKATAISTGGLSFLGITEPALYGILVPHKKPLYASIVGGAIGGAVSMLLTVKAFTYSMPGIFSLPTYIGANHNIVKLIISLIVTFIAAFVASYLMMKKKKGV